ncbi:MAG: tetratricopeptide repeat protein [Isosphaeraceae bacterium]
MGSSTDRVRGRRGEHVFGQRFARARGWGGLALTIALAVGLAAWFRSSSEPSEARVVVQLLDEGRWDEARETVRRGLADRPGSSEVQLALAWLEYRRGRLAEAIEATGKARSMGHESAPLDRLQGLILAEARRDVEAESILSPILERSDGKDLEVAEALAKLFLRTYKLPQAKRVLERWIEVAPADARPYLWLTDVDRRTVADPNVWIAHYLAALERDPRLTPALLGLAEAYLASKQPAKAARAFQDYLAIRPDDPKAHLGAARAAKDLGDEKAVARHLSEALRLAPNDPGALKEQAAHERREGELEAALATIDRALEIDSLDSELFYQRSLVLAQLGRHEESEATRREMAKLKKEQDEILAIHEKLLTNPNDQTLRGKVAVWMLDHGQTEQAVQWARLILARDPSHAAMNQLLARYHRNRGEVGLANYYGLRAGGEE